MCCAFGIRKKIAPYENEKYSIDRECVCAVVTHELIPHLSAFAMKGITPSNSKIGEIVDGLRTQSHDAVKALTKEKEALEQKIAGLVALVSTQEAKVSELADAVEAHKKEAIAVKAEVKGEYATTETELRAEFTAAILKMKSEYEEFSNKTKTAAEAHLTELNSKETKAKTILNLIGNDDWRPTAFECRLLESRRCARTNHVQHPAAFDQ